MERRYTNHRATVEKREDGKGTITGYAAVFYRDGDHSTEYVLWDDQFSRAVERVTPSAFSRALREKQDIRALFNHDPNQLLGRTTAGTATVTVDETGLRYEIDPGNTQVGRDVVEHIARGDVDGSSFTFTIPAGGDKWTRTTDEEGRVLEVRELLDVDLFDVSPVVFPAYEGTSVSMRSASDISELRAKRNAERRSLESQRLVVEAELAEREIES